jgi:hypothetical protein
LRFIGPPNSCDCDGVGYPFHPGQIVVIELPLFVKNREKAGAHEQGLPLSN